MTEHFPELGPNAAHRTGFFVTSSRRFGLTDLSIFGTIYIAQTWMREKSYGGEPTNNK